MRYLSVCSGMEAASVAWHPLGWKPVGFSEIEPFPCAILKHRFPDTPNYGSLTDYAQWPIERGAADLLVGGTPCQSFSVAGLRKGLEDPRGNLALVFLGLADKLKPRWIVWENVPGVLSSNGGRDFGSFLGALVQLGYGFAYRVLDAQHFGVPQRRRRVFVVACLGDWRAPAEVLFEPDCVRRDPKKGRAKGQGAAAGAEGGVGADHSAGCWWEGGQVSQTLDAVLQPKPVVIDRAAFNQGQNAQYEPHIGESEVMDSLVARGPHAVGQPIDPKIVQASELRLRGHITEQDTVPTLLANTKSGDNDPLAVHPVAFQPGNLRRQAGAAPSTETFPTLKCDSGDQMPHVCHPVIGFSGRDNGADAAPQISPTLRACNDHKYDRSSGWSAAVAYPAAAAFKSGQGSAARSIGWDENVSPTLPANAGGNTAPAVIGTMTAMAVRRLTPVECERLQGFPDNWSRIPWKGKPEEECPDGPRYKACGNSMAVPVMRWIGERIAAVEARNISRQ